MDLKQLEYFVAVAEHRSFSRASASLGVAQSALSRQVRALEMELHDILLTRTGRGVELTESGRRFFDHSSTILQQVEVARNDLQLNRDEPVGHITLALPPSMGRQLTLPLIDAFQRQLPHAKLAVVEGLSTHITEWITSGRVDLGLLFNPDSQQGLEVVPIFKEPLCLVERTAGREAGAQSARGGVTLTELAQLPLILPERAHVIRRLLESEATLAGVMLNIAWEVSSVAAILDLVCAGYGHAVLTASAVLSSGRADQLAVRPLSQPVLYSVLCLATPAHKRGTALTRHVGRLLQDLTQSLPQAAAAQSLPG
jgi:LysR family nitrogen assimilation transcriptional regulator